jgi:pantothenate kinase
LCEGLYLLHDEGGWETTKDFFDYNIFVDADVDTCIERLKIRNKCIPGYTEDEIEMRCEEVDRVNAMTVDRSKKRADLVVESVASHHLNGLENHGHASAQ